MAAIEPPDASEKRYAGRPLLRLLDCYVLALTGHLHPEMEAKVATYVKGRFGGDDDWKATLRRSIKLPDDMDERIQGLWRSQEPGTDPLAFATSVSDANFLPMIDPG